MATEAASKPAPPTPGGASAQSADDAIPGRLSRALQDNVLSGWLARHEFALRRLQSLAGILFGGYIIFHLVVNATLVEGVRYDDQATVYQLQVDRIHALPFLGILAFVLVLLPILFHSIYGIIILMSGRPNVDRYGYPKNWAWLLQRVTAIILVLFIAFHYLSMKGAFGGDLGRMLAFVPVDHATQSVVNHVHAAWWVGWFLFPVGIIAAAYHTAYGFWTAGITWGLTISSRAQRVWLRVCIALCILLLACGFAALGAALGGEPTDQPLGVYADEQAEPARESAPSRPEGADAPEAEPASTQPSDFGQAPGRASSPSPPPSILR